MRLCSNPSPWRLDIAGNAVDPDAVSMQHGGIADKNFAKIINEGSDDDEIELISHSPYYYVQLSSETVFTWIISIVHRIQ